MSSTVADVIVATFRGSGVRNVYAIRGTDLDMEASS